MMFKCPKCSSTLKEWSCEIEVKFTQYGIEAKSKEDFVKLLKDNFKEEYNLDLKDHEIKNIQEMPSGYYHIG